MPSYAIISDVHANLESLNAVLAVIEGLPVENILFLGDAVGYGPDPNECVELIRKKSALMIAGNHDLAAAAAADLTYFNPYAREAIEWTAAVLKPALKGLLGRLPLTGTVPEEGIFIVHASPRDPEGWHYIDTLAEARMGFQYFTGQICFIGHSHVPIIIELMPDGTVRTYEDRAVLQEKCRYIINAGSTGQPRDGNPDAAYAMLRGNIVEIIRVSYDIVRTQQKMRDAGLPAFLIQRLALGR